MVKNKDRWSALSMSERADLINTYMQNGVLKLNEMREHYNSFGDGGSTNEGGWSKNTLEQRERRYKRYDPAGGLGPITQGVYVLMGGNQSEGEENEYWKAYLGLDNAVPKMNPNAKTSWDDSVEQQKVKDGKLPSDFYGTTPRMDLNIQAIADTLNTGRIYRDYDNYKAVYPELPAKWRIEEIYNTGKRVLENPNEWQQVDGDNTAIKRGLDPLTNEMSPLGMLANFGMMWNPEENAIYVHDTYDFPKVSRIVVGDRPKEMKIRSKISFDPKKGSKLLRDDMKSFYNYPEAITNALGGSLYNKHNPIESFSGSSKIPVVRKSLTRR